MKKRNKQINQIVKKIQTISEEDLHKVEAFVEELNAIENNVNEISDTTIKRLHIQDFSFIKAKKFTEKLNSSLADEVIKERNSEIDY